MDQFTDTLCLQCGLCCNGVLFADVRAGRDDPSPIFRQYGSRVVQPCPAFNSGACTCAIYAERPGRCRKFECRQLLAVRAGTVATTAALRRIRTARKLVAKIENLLGELDFNQTNLPLKRRFQKCQRAAENGKMASSQLDRLARLQFAMHQLTILLAEHFHP
jgi:uncharacterized protein